MKLKRRKVISNQHIKLLLVLFSLFFIGIAFSYLEARLVINGQVAIKNGMWNVHFENLVVESGSVTAATPATIHETKRKIIFSVDLSKKGEYYEFEVDIVNSGEIDAMVSDAKLSGLPDSLKSFVEYKLTYADDVEIKENDALFVGATERIKVRLNFIDGVDLSKLPIEELFDLTLEIPYVQATDEAAEREPVEDNGGSNIIHFLGLDKGAVLDSIQSTYVSSPTGVDFIKISSDTNGKGIYIYKGTENNDFPIYYYRGEVNNNIIFANFCWKIVRTTDTGGTKLIYNGVPSATNTCNNTGEASQLDSKSAFNKPYSDVKYIGYTYDADLTTNPPTATDSTIKGVIDKWYKTNIEDKGYSSYLEDTIWCTDRKGSKIGTDSSKTYYGFGVRSELNKEKPIVTCPMKEDSHTVDRIKGNGLLIYPVALLTGDEAQLAGLAWKVDNISSGSISFNNTTYLYTGEVFWLLSPNHYDSSGSDAGAFATDVYSKGSLDNLYSGASRGVRPSLSLKVGTKVTTVGNSGEAGTADNPYIVVYDN